MRRTTLIVLLLLLGAGLASAQQMNGTYTIKPDGTGDFLNPYAAGEAIRSRGMNGHVVFDIYPGSYTLPGYVNISSVSGASSYTMTWKAADSTNMPVITYNSSYVFYGYNTYNVKLRHLWINNSSSWGVYVSNACNGWNIDHCVIRSSNGIYNYNYNNYNDTIQRCDIKVTSSYGIHFENNGGYGYNHVIANNLIYGWTSYGIYAYYSYYMGIYYNTVMGTGSYGLYQRYAYYDTLKNNVFMGASYAWYRYYANYLPAYSDYNDFWLYNGNTGSAVIYNQGYGSGTVAWWRNYGRDANSIQLEPMTGWPANPRLRNGSPCIDHGIAMPRITHDIDGTVRPYGSTPDIGAYEWNNSWGPAMSGTYYVKPGVNRGDTFSSITGTLDAMAMRGLSGNVTFSIFGGTYNGALDFNGFSQGAYRVTWQNRGADTVILDAGGASYAIQTYGNTKLRFVGLWIQNFTSWGVYFPYNSSTGRGTDTCVVMNCHITGPNGIHLYYFNNYDSLVGNVINASSSYGIYCYAYTSPGSYYNVIANNFITGNYSSYGIYFSYGNYQMYYTKVYHNTIFTRNSQYCIYDNYTQYTDYKNNVFYNLYNSSNSVGIYKYQGGTMYANGNVYWMQNNPNQYCMYHSSYGWMQLSTCRSYGFEANGQYRNPRIIGQSSPRLCTGSPCVDSGVTGLGITVDYEGQARDAHPDNGCDEYTSPGAPMSGTYTIKQDGTGNYRTFREAIDAVTLRSQSGPVEFEAYAGTYRETLDFTGFANTHRVTFRAHQTLDATDEVIIAPTYSYGVFLRDNAKLAFRNLVVTGFTSYGFYLSYATSKGSDSITIAGCRIEGPNGIYMGYYCDDDSIIGNNIRSTSSYGIYQEGHSSTYTQRLVIANNFITGWTSVGVRLNYHNATQLYHNTIISSGSYAIQDQYGWLTQVSNNILQMLNSTQCYYKYYGSSVIQWDYNCLYTPYSYVVYWFGSNYNWSSWRSLGYDQHGINRPPSTAAPLDLHLRANSPCIDSATAGTGILTDIDGDARDPSHPDMGADEFTTIGAPMSGVYTIKQDGTGDYRNFTEAFGALALRGWGGNVQFDVYSGTYTGMVNLNGIGNRPYRLVIRAYPGEDVTLDAGGNSYGFRLYNNRLIHIEGFKIQNFTSYGIWASTYAYGDSTPDNCAFVGNTITGPNGIYTYYGSFDTVAGNTIHATSSYGIYHQGYSGSPYGRAVTVYNNMVDGSSSYGFYFSYINGLNVYYNSANMTGSYGVRFEYCWFVKHQNNTWNGGSYGLYWYSGGDVWPQISNYNNYYRGGSNPLYHYNYGSITLANWQSYSGLDGASRSVDPQHVAANNTHLRSGSPLIGAGFPVSGIAKDVDGDNRHPSTPCIGGDEFYIDMAVRSVLAPTGAVTPGSVVTPRAAIKHLGGGAATFYVVMVLDSSGVPFWRDSVSRTTSPGDSVVVSFANWTANPARGGYHATCFHKIAGDATPSNDTAKSDFSVGSPDCGVTAIVAPAAAVTEGSVIYPRVTVRNNGNVNANFTLRVTIDDGTDRPEAKGEVGIAARTGANRAAIDALVYDRTRSCYLPVGAESTYAFTNYWTATPAGVYTAKAKITLAGDTSAANDSLVQTVNVHRYDAAAVALVYPSGIVSPGNIAPQVRVRNYGTSRQQVTVTTRINALPEYVGTTTLPNGLPPGVDTVVTCPVWAGDAGYYTARCSVYTAGDIQRSNDTLSTNFQVATVDVSSKTLLAPTGVYETSAVITPRAVFHNYGDNAATFAGYMLLRTAGDSLVYSEMLTIANLGSGGDTTVTFPEWAKPHGTGSYAVRCSAYVSGDGEPANDALGGSFTVYAAGTGGDTGFVRQGDVPLGAKSKKVKDGGALTYGEEDIDATGFVYALKGNNRYEFYAYNTTGNTWTTRESIPAIGRAGKKKAVKKGSTLAWDDGTVFAAKGNNSVEWWAYTPGDTAAYVWQQRADVPLGAKTLREGTGSAVVKIGDTTYVYLLKGSGTTEFYRYNIATNMWESRASAPMGTSGKAYKNGSGLTASTDGKTLFAVKGSYNEMFIYDVDSNTWTQKTSLPLVGSLGKKKKVKDGAGLAYHSGNVYALKGGNTVEFWKYTADSDKWAQLPDVPAGSGKNIKGGGAITYGARPAPALWILKGNNTFDFFKYGFGAMTNDQAPMTNAGVQSGASFRTPHSALRIAPNPWCGSELPLAISYSLPASGNVSLKLYDVTGKLVTTLGHGYHAAGAHNVSLRAERSNLANGIYLLKLETETSTATTKLIIE